MSPRWPHSVRRHPPPAPFVGRATNLAALVAQLDERGVAVLMGGTGAGKTALLAALAAQVRRPVRATLALVTAARRSSGK